MHTTSQAFKKNVKNSLKNAVLQKALTNLKPGFVHKRQIAIDNLPEFDTLRDEARDIKNHVLQHLDFYLEHFEKEVLAQGGHVHWASNDEDARKIILTICQSVNAKIVTKGKSMLSEEIGLNKFLENTGINVVETDLGEYIIQLRKEPPSHIVAPAIHVSEKEIREDFYKHHQTHDAQRSLDTPAKLLLEARGILREKYFQADVGITGANFIVAENGASVIVTNEGNGDLTQTLAKVHVVIAGIEKIVPTLEDLSTFIRLLARSATGQEMSTYVTFSHGARHATDLDGPEQFHVVLVDNGRSAMLKTELQDMLRCIRCGACMNHCPVYGAIGGHAYGWVYPGPMGAVLTPHFIGLHQANDLPNASTFCGRCEDVCPVRIPLPDMMRSLREKEFSEKISSKRIRAGLAVWAFMAARPALYQRLTSFAIRFLRIFSGKKGVFRKLPFASAWTQHRDFPAPSGKTFQHIWKKNHE
jgi:L-lactate dehydrogenase complex protein LldF